MEFMRIMSRLIPTLKMIAVGAESRVRVEDADDLFQRMSIHLWQRWKAGELEGKTPSYMLQSAYFHLQNHLRSVQNGFKLFSLDIPASDEDGSWLDTFVAPEELEGETAEAWLVVHRMRNNGLSIKEKAVVEFLLRGYTARETGGQMGVSHVTVLKWKKSIEKKWRQKIDRG